MLTQSSELVLSATLWSTSITNTQHSSFFTVFNLTRALIGQRAPLSSALTRDFLSVPLAVVIEEVVIVTRVRHPRAYRCVGIL